MNRVLILLCVGFMVFSCKSKKAVVAKEPDTSSKQAESKPKVYTDKTERYIDMHKATAQQEMKLYGIPASITMAQGILESGSGQGRLALEANNHFGIKCHEWTGAKIYHDDDDTQECFRKYVDAKYSFRDHSLFLTERVRYSKLFELNQKDYTGWASALKTAGYATDKSYPQKLIYIIERYRLYKLDEEVLAANRSKEKTPSSNVSKASNQDVLGKSVKEEASASVGRGVYTVLKGDTQYSISKKYSLTVKELQNLNGLSNTNLMVGQILVVSSSTANKTYRKAVSEDPQVYVPKKNRPTVKESQSTKKVTNATGSKVYTVEKGDTQYSISKKHNISVKELQNLNGLSNTNLRVGQVLVVSSSIGNTNSPTVKESQSTKKVTNATGSKVYTVEKGDTQYSISKKHNITVKELQNLNGLKNTNISIGQVLVVKP